RPVTRGFYDAMGRSLGTLDANANPTTERYDAAGQLVAEMHADGGALAYQYNIFGQVVRATDALGNSTFSSYDHDGRLVQLARPTGTETYAYDQAGNRIRSTDAVGATTFYWYDTRGKMIRSQLPGGQRTGYGYDLRGNKVAELNANGDSMSWSYDYFGKLLAHTDLGGAAYSYTYDLTGNVTQQALIRGASSSVIAFQYYENGALKRSHDTGIDDDTSYEYDAAGNRTRELTRVGTYVEDSSIAYDELARIARVQSTHLPFMNYRYDAVGNRRNVNGVSADGPVDNWYLYDGMNRTVLSQGALSGGAIVRGSQGIELQYDAAGNRRAAITAASTESYGYDAGNRLTTTVRNGVLVGTQSYDAAGRIVQQFVSAPPSATGVGGSDGGQPEYIQNTYNANGWITQQDIRDGAGTLTQSTVYDGYDAVGNVTHYQISVAGANGGTSFTNFFSLAYAKFEVYKESTASGTSTYFLPGTTTTTYDINGNVVSVFDPFNNQRVGQSGGPVAATSQRMLITDSSGQILQKTQDGKTQRFFYADGKPIGTSGALSGTNFDFNYTAVSQQYPSATPTAYTVMRGDTLRSIASALLGDANLWYVIADANGIASDADLQAGMRLTIPNKVLSVHNDYQTFKVYNPAEVVGDVTPNLPDPPPPPTHGCGIFGVILVAIVAVVVSVFTAGAALALFAPEALVAGTTAAEASFFASGAAVLTGSGITGASVLTVAAAAAVGGAVGSIASQGLGIALGVQQKFSWGAVAAAGLSAGITAGIGAGLGEGGIAGKLLQVPTGVGQQALNGAINNAISQGINILTGQQHAFDWRGLAAAAIVAPLSKAIGSAFPGIGAGFVSRFVGGIANGAIKAALGGKVDFVHVAADAFGNALGNAITDSLAQSGQQAQALGKAQQTQLLQNVYAMATPDELQPAPQSQQLGKIGVAPHTPIAETNAQAATDDPMGDSMIVPPSPDAEQTDSQETDLKPQVAAAGKPQVAAAGGAPGEGKELRTALKLLERVDTAYYAALGNSSSPGYEAKAIELFAKAAALRQELLEYLADPAIRQRVLDDIKITPERMSLVNKVMGNAADVQINADQQISGGEGARFINSYYGRQGLTQAERLYFHATYDAPDSVFDSALGDLTKPQRLLTPDFTKEAVTSLLISMLGEPGFKVNPRVLSTILANKAAGAAWEAYVIDNVLPQTQVNIQKQITLKSNGPSGLRVRVDAVGEDIATGALKLTDPKASQTAPYTPNQAIVYPELAIYGG
ncbi:MAG TPA: LysM peptidoglycan-binding domain-containing protein, partial [Vicinamibacterales bacterium]|nr:LysM peptidoglycan-binding domain-containing protein [Vicinamibacterales bacterium]